MSDTHRFRILIADDERANITALRQVLQPLYAVSVAIDGQTALSLAKEVLPDLILLDVVMPDINGYDVLTALKRDDATRHIPVIFITGLDSTRDEEKGFALGAADYITKPFHDAIVKARVKTQLQIVRYVRTIEHLGLIDVLTNLSNRRDFDRRIDTEWHRALREQEPLSMLMIDIDRFKDFNDHYGHLLGDNALQAVANGIRQVLKRKTDYAARWGGEEFVVLLPHTKAEGAQFAAEQVRVAVAEQDIHGVDTRLTVSIGVNTEIPTTSRSLHDFIEGADKALYAAKRAGRNRVCSSGCLQEF